MNGYPESNSEQDDGDARWLRELLRDDAVQTPHLADDGFTARVLQALPPPQRRWLDGLSATIVAAALGVGLLYFTGLLQAPLSSFAWLLRPRRGHAAAAAAEHVRLLQAPDRPVGAAERPLRPPRRPQVLQRLRPLRGP